MPIHIRFAKLTQELNDILDFRFLMLSLARPESFSSSNFTNKFVDAIDIYPSTQNLYASKNGKILGSLRTSEFISNDPIQNFSFNFSESAKNLKGKIGFIDLLCLSSNCAQKWETVNALFSLSVQTFVTNKIDYALTVCPEEGLENLKTLGFEPISSAFFCEKLQSKVIPLKIKIENFLKYFEFDFVDKEILRFQEIFYRSVYEPGEIMAVEGDKGATAFLITKGEVEVILYNQGKLTPIATLKRGHLIGEIAMITSETRTASLVVKESTSTISFDRQEFLSLMYKEPHRTLDIFRIFSKRLSDSNKKILEKNQNA